jgi:hypothetical protein
MVIKLFRTLFGRGSVDFDLRFHVDLLEASSRSPTREAVRSATNDSGDVQRTPDDDAKLQVWLSEYNQTLNERNARLGAQLQLASVLFLLGGAVIPTSAIVADPTARVLIFYATATLGFGIAIVMWNQENKRNFADWYCAAIAARRVQHLGAVKSTDALPATYHAFRHLKADGLMSRLDLVGDLVTNILLGAIPASVGFLAVYGQHSSAVNVSKFDGGIFIWLPVAAVTAFLFLAVYAILGAIASLKIRQVYKRHPLERE